MKLPSPSVRKLFREIFSGEKPIRVTPKERADAIKFWHNRLKKIDGVCLTTHPGDRDSRSQTLCRFTIPDPQDGGIYWRTNELRLGTDDEHFLQIQSFHSRAVQHAARVSDAAEIETLARQVLVRYTKRRAGELKREKVRGFKTKAILAKVARLAEEEQFDFATATDKQKLRLFVRLSHQHLVAIDIPFKQFDLVLPQLRTTIATMRRLYAEGLRFQIATDRILPWHTTWIENKKKD